MKLARTLSGEGLKARTIRSTLMTGLNFGGQNFLRLAGNLVLTRLLFPEAFGIMAIVQVVRTGVAMFSDLGIRASIVRDERGQDPAFLNTAWTIQVARGVLLWLVICAAANPVATFYEAPILAQLLPVAGLTAVLQGFNSTKLATANRQLRLGRVTVVALSSQAIGLLVTIGLALWLKSVWALVLGGLVSTTLITVLSHIALPGGYNWFALDRDALRRLIGFGKYIFLATVAGFLISQGDRAIIGKIASLEDLAFYNIAFFLASVPVLLTRKMSDNILFPLYSARDPSENQTNYNNIARARLFILGGAAVMLIALALIGNALISFLYDPRYHDAGPLLILIAVSQLPTMVTASYGSVLLASGNSGRFAALMISSALIRLAAIGIGAFWFGLFGIALAPVLSAILFYPFTVWFIRPFHAWVPRQDLILALLSALTIAVVTWVHYDLLWFAWERFGPS